MRTIIALSFVVAVGCGSSDGATSDTDDTARAEGSSGGGEAPDPGGGSTTEPAAPTEPIADVPYPASEIRDATPAGRTYVFRFREGTAVRYERWVFEEVSERGYVSSTTPVDEAGETLGETERSEGTWAELEAHAHFPLDSTEIGNAVVTMPAGRFRCRLYTVTEEENGHDVRSRFWFANNLPGAPIRMIREVDGESVVEMELVSHEPPISAP